MGKRENENFNNKRYKSSTSVKFNFPLILLFFSVLIFSLPSVSSDVISVNSGGSEQIIINPDIYIEGFYSGGFCGDGIIDIGIGEQCDNGAANGACPATCSTSCATNSCEVTPPEGGGGAGGGGGGGATYQYAGPTTCSACSTQACH